MADRYDLYFAYGSNLYTRQMQMRCPSAEVISVAYINNYTICFPVVSEKRGRGGVASIKRKKGRTVRGVIYRLKINDLQVLDNYEARGVRYERKKIFVKLKNDVRKHVWTYIAISDHSKDYMPSEEYLDLIIKGLEEHNLPKDHLSGIK